MAELNAREKAQARARKHASRVWDCPICGRECRGNGGKASHQRMHVRDAGYDQRDIFGWGLRVLFRALWSDSPRPEGLRAPYGRNLDEEEWNTRELPHLGGNYKYVVIRRAPGDPERTDRARSLGGKTWGPEKIAALEKLRKAPVDEWRDRILRHLADSVPRTFNRLGVELCDRTADMLLGSNAEKALWALVESGQLEHTMASPILFRRRKRS